MLCLLNFVGTSLKLALAVRIISARTSGGAIWVISARTSGGSYFKNCLILGRTDYIYGGGIGYFDSCEIRSFGGGWITAPSTPKGQDYGFVFYKCKLTFSGKSPKEKDNNQLVSLGRPWHNFPKVAWIKCEMGKEINPVGWSTIWNMNYASTSADLHLFEYKNIGAGSDMSRRANWAGIRELTSIEVNRFTVKNVLKGQDDWQPFN